MSSAKARHAVDVSAEVRCAVEARCSVSSKTRNCACIRLVFLPFSVSSSSHVARWSCCRKFVALANLCFDSEASAIDTSFILKLRRRMGGGNNINSVFYAESYHPIQAGSIDGTDVLPHDNAVYRALLCSSAGLYDPFGDPKAIGEPYCTLFVGRLSHLTTEETLLKVMSKYGRVKNLRLVRDIVTGASRGYAFVEYETEKEMHSAYQDAHHCVVDDCEIIVDYNRQQLMAGWIPRRLGGGLGGKKESGQLRFGGRERPFRAPLRPIPYQELERLGIPPPPEGKYISRFQVPSPPRRQRNDLEGETRRRGGSMDRREGSHKRSSIHREDYSDRRSPLERKERERSHKRKERDEPHRRQKHGHHHSHREN